MVDNSD